jgi:hypothetical protein
MNKSGIYSELKKFSTTLYNSQYSKIFDKNNDISISPVEWSYVQGNTTTNAAPGKFMVGIHTEQLHNNADFTSGISTQQGGIVARVSLNTATNIALNTTMLVVADAFLNFDFVTGQTTLIT